MEKMNKRRIQCFFKFSWRDTGITIGFLAIATLCCFFLHEGERNDTHALLLFVLTVLLVMAIEFIRHKR